MRRSRGSGLWLLCVRSPADLVALDRAVVRCRRCPRLVEWREDVARVKRAAFADEDYWGRPVPGFGSAMPRIWVIGLAPAAHGANRTGRMFTGDRSGDWLFASMHRVGLAALPTSASADDGQQLDVVRLTAAVHCAPPDNKPTTQEKAECAQWLRVEAGLVEPSVRVIVALGGIAWAAARSNLHVAGWQVPTVPFGHGAQTVARTPTGREVVVLASYHPSQQNTFTGRLTEPMLDDVLGRAASLAGLP
mgnify:CR=1 FL=1